MVKVSRVLVCGMKGVGKTAVIEQLVYGNITRDNVRQQLYLEITYRHDTKILFQDLIPTIEDVYIASVDAGRTPRDLIRIFDIGGLQGNGQVSVKSISTNFI